MYLIVLLFFIPVILWNVWFVNKKTVAILLWQTKDLNV